MLSQMLGILFIGFLALAQAPPKAPPPPPTAEELEKAKKAGEDAGAVIGDGISAAEQKDLSTQQTEYNTLQKSSVDSMMNGQKGQAASISMANSLTSAAAPYAKDCDPSTLDGTTACATGSVLAGMSGQMDVSTPTYTGPIDLAWSNMCHFSTFGCTSVPSNPYLPLIPISSDPPTPTLPEIIDTLKDKGYVVDPKTGVITIKDGSTINVNDKKSVSKALGESGYASLKNLLQTMQNDLASRFAKLSVKNYMKSIGFDGLRNFGNKVVEAVTRESGDMAGQQNHAGHYNRIPEKSREKINLSDLVKNYRGTPIGVSAADIFKMIKKRYDIKASQKVFLSPEVQVFRQSVSEK